MDPKKGYYPIFFLYFSEFLSYIFFIKSYVELFFFNNIKLSKYLFQDQPEKEVWIISSIFSDNNIVRFGRGNADFEKFYLTSLSAFAGGANNFTQQVQSHITRSKIELLSHLFSLLPYAEGFSSHHPELHTTLGLRKDGRGLTEMDLENSGGSIGDLATFVQTAKTSAVEVLRESPIKRFLVGGDKGRAASQQKRSKVHDRETKFEEEVKDKTGPERIYSDAFTGSLDLEISSLEIDPVLSPRLRLFHMEGIKNAMLRRFDPSLLCIAVRPVDPSLFDPENPTASRYYVIQGVHSFSALKKLKNDGKLSLLTGMKDEVLTVTVVNVEDADLVLFGHMRSNTLASTFIRKPQPQVLQY